MSWRERFNMSGPPLPRGVAGDTFFEGDPNFQRLARVFAWLAAESSFLVFAPLSNAPAAHAPPPPASATTITPAVIALRCRALR